MNNTNKYLDIAVKSVNEAGVLIRDILQSQKLEVNFKTDNSPQTNADIIAENLIRNQILSAFPEHGFIGEEGNKQSDKEYIWICDPVDGTWAMINGEHSFATSLLLKRKGKVILAVVNNPMNNQLFTAEENDVSLLNSIKLPIDKSSLAGIVLNYQISLNNKNGVENIRNLINSNVIKKAVSTGGSPAYNLALVAAGIHSAFISQGTRPYDSWDIDGGIFIIKQAGGNVEILHDGLLLIAACNYDLLERIKAGYNFH